MVAESEAGTSTGHTEAHADEQEHYGPHHAPEWQPWDRGSKFILALGIIAVLGLIAVFVSLTMHH